MRQVRQGDTGGEFNSNLTYVYHFIEPMGSFLQQEAKRTGKVFWLAEEERDHESDEIGANEDQELGKR